MSAKLKSKVLIVCLFLLLIPTGLYFYGNIENSLLWYELVLLQPSKETPTSVSNVTRESEEIPDRNFLLKKANFSGEKEVILEQMKTYKSKTDTKIEKDVKENAVKVEDRERKDEDLTDKNCKKKAVKLSGKSLPITGLVSFPGSGNTWTRHIIQQMTGIGTSSVYCDGSLRDGGFPYECHSDKSKTVVVKTHEPAKQLHMFEKIVLLLRNPYDALLSFVHYIKAGHTGHATKEDLIKASNGKFEYSIRWYVNIQKIVTENFKGPVYVIQYENLQSNMSSELKKLAAFLDVKVSESDIACTVKLQDGNFHRLTKENKHLEVLRAAYSKEKFLRLQETARFSEKLMKDSYNIDIDLGGSTENFLLQGFQGSNE